MSHPISASSPPWQDITQASPHSTGSNMLRGTSLPPPHHPSTRSHLPIQYGPFYRGRIVTGGFTEGHRNCETAEAGMQKDPAEARTGISAEKSEVERNELGEQKYINPKLKTTSFWRGRRRDAKRRRFAISRGERKR
ncbi:unnamed protein product [Microthlaspi erraticum]|uniref:Uncharacterized protein n=1 Tax=Microthlaspi erraticum TaxID=1685480 RepID=A0A6D2IDD5_9BRAS|nr:unnamed protein product [Microthlaspi erraticum]